MGIPLIVQIKGARTILFQSKLPVVSAVEPTSFLLTLAM
jgi:hypothetical protein